MGKSSERTESIAFLSFLRELKEIHGDLHIMKTSQEQNLFSSASLSPHTPDSPPAVAFMGVHKWYGAFHALKNISFQVAMGEKLVLCGPSGCGKSTLLRCINRLEVQQEGEIFIEGKKLTSDPRQIQAVRRRVGMCFQSFNLFPHLSVLENCTLAPRSLFKLGRAEARELAMETLRKVHLADQALKYPNQLSGGQQQRVAIARALCLQPRVLLFDEPTSALDPEMTWEVLEVILELAREGMTMLCATHEMGFARALADRIFFLDGGELLEEAPPEVFFKTPQHPRSQAFLARQLYFDFSEIKGVT